MSVTTSISTILCCVIRLEREQRNYENKVKYSSAGSETLRVQVCVVYEVVVMWMVPFMS